jgi:porin
MNTPLTGSAPGLVRFWVGAACVLAVTAAAAADPDSPAPATEPAAATPAAETQPAGPGPYLTGDWGGRRAKLVDQGFTFGGFVQLDISHNFQGGVTTSLTAFRDLLDLNATVDLEKVCGWHGGHAYADFQSLDGPNATAAVVGDGQGFDSLDGPHFVQFSQLWLQQKFAGDQLWAKLGKIDANNDFCVIDHGKEFLNSAAAYSVTMFPFPTYPDPAPGAELFLDPGGRGYVGAGVFYSNSHQNFLDFVGQPESLERQPDGAFYIGEAGYRWKLSSGDLPGHAAVGGWGHTGDTPRWNGGTAAGTGGFYSLADQTLWHEESKDGQVVRDVGLFVQYGWADPAVAPAAQNLAAGLAAAGLIPRRPKDVVGLAAAWAHLGDEPRLEHPYELAVEGFYKLQLLSWAILKPDLQYINHPGGVHGDALVFTLRMEVDF